MPSIRQPKPLLMMCESATGSMIITRILSCSHPSQEKSIRESLHNCMPPVVLQNVLSSVIRQLGTVYSHYASAPVISRLLRILLHPRMTELDLSDLIGIGNVELDSLDVVEATLVEHLPAMSQLTHLDFSTHRIKITFPSCSDKMLEVLGSCCPNLQVLNLNFNNRVTGNGLIHLYPTECNETGCGKLEKLYVLGCSIEVGDVALALCSLPNIELVGYGELGTVLLMLKKRPKTFGVWGKERCLKLTHLDNTISYHQLHDGDIVEFLVNSCPYMENLKVRVNDKTLSIMHKLSNLKHLEVRFFTNRHYPVGTCTQLYLRTYGCHLSSFTIYCNVLEAEHVLTIAESCVNLKKLFLHANLSTVNSNTPLDGSRSKLQNLEMLSLRLGDDELVMNPSACDILIFLLEETQHLQELYVMVRCPGLDHNFVESLLRINPLSHLKNLIIDVPRRTMSAPMLDVTAETVYVLMRSCDKLKILGNLICWNVTQEEVAEIRTTSQMCNFNLTIVYANSNKLNTKYM